jgi:hypothetical protein
MSQTQTTLAEQLERSRPSGPQGSEQKSAVGGVGDKVTLTDWTGSLDSTGQLFTQCIVTPKVAGDTIWDVSIGLYSSDGKKLYCWGLVGPTFGSKLSAPSLDASACTNLYDPKIHGTSLIGVVAGDLNSSGLVNHFRLEKAFTIAA